MPTHADLNENKYVDRTPTRHPSNDANVGDFIYEVAHLLISIDYRLFFGCFSPGFRTALTDSAVTCGAIELTPTTALPPAMCLLGRAGPSATIARWPKSSPGRSPPLPDIRNPSIPAIGGFFASGIRISRWGTFF